MSYQVSGTVLDIHGYPINEVEMQFTGGFASVYTDTHGYWEATLDGTITVTPVKKAHVFDPISRIVSGAEINVDFTGRHHRYIEYNEVALGIPDLGWSYTISGQVLDFYGEPMEGVKISFEWPGFISCPLEPAYTEADGTWEKELCLAEVKVIPSKKIPFPNGYEYYTFNPEHRIISVADTAVDFQAEQADPIPVIEESRQEENDVSIGVTGIEWTEIAELDEEISPEENEVTVGVVDIAWMEIVTEEKVPDTEENKVAIGIIGISWQFIVTAPPYEVTGAIRDVNDKPIEGIEVTFTRLEDNHVYDSVHTNHLGEYHKINVHHTVRVRPVSEQYPFVPEYIDVEEMSSGINFIFWLYTTLEAPKFGVQSIGADYVIVRVIGERL